MDETNEKIRILLQEFAEKSQMYSSPLMSLNKDCAQKLIMIGEPVLAHVSNSRLTLTIHTMALLEEIAGTSPVTEDGTGNVNQMAEDWFEWLHKNGY